jgi:hypothetical protein
VAVFIKQLIIFNGAEFSDFILFIPSTLDGCILNSAWFNNDMRIPHHFFPAIVGKDTTMSDLTESGLATR